jgi:hypothetical protein
MDYSTAGPPKNKGLIWIFVGGSLFILFIIFRSATGSLKYIFAFFILLFILWFNKYASSKIKTLFGLNLQGGNLTVTRTIAEPGVYNVFSDMVTGIGNMFMYIVTFEFMNDKNKDTNS